MIVYVGAVAVIFLFVLMLLNAKDQADIKDLMVHTTQYLAVIVIVALFGRSVVQVYKPVEAFVISRESGLTVLEPTSAEAVEFFVRFQFNDISTIVPLYTQHGVTFVVLTTVLLSALLGAIILATQTTERPVSAQTSQEVTPRRVVTPVKAVASLFTAAGSFCLPSLDACELFTLFSFFATLCAVTPFYRKGRYSKFPAARPPANILPSRY
jgi:NADH:ubiquinone oxidoreductase subunit 6 (subunit J)